MFLIFLYAAQIIRRNFPDFQGRSENILTNLATSLSGEAMDIVAHMVTVCHRGMDMEDTEEGRTAAPAAVTVDLMAATVEVGVALVDRMETR